MPLSLATAEAALGVATGVESLDRNVVKPGDLQGRVTTHWTFFVFVAGSMIGVVVAVAAAVFQMWSLVALGAVMCATNVIGSVYSYTLSSLPALEEAINRLAERVRNLSDIIIELNRVRTELNDIAERASGLASQYKETIDTTNKDLRSKIEEIEKTNKKVTDLEKKFEKFRGIVVDMEKTTSELTKDTVEFGLKSDLLKGKVDHLDASLIDLKNSNISFQDGISKIDKNNDKFEVLAGTLTKQIDIWKSLIIQIKENFLNTKKEIDSLKEKMTKFDKTVSHAKSETDREEELVKELNKTKDQLLEHTKNRALYLDFLQHKPEYLEWKKTQKIK